MNIRRLTCIECPMGCQIEASIEEGKILSLKGYSCPRGKAYAESEIVCPMRVVTSTVRAADGRIIPVKTDRPVKKDEMFEIMKKINAVHPTATVRLGDVLFENIAENVNLVATDDSLKPIRWIMRGNAGRVR